MSEYTDELFTFISVELSQFEASYVLNRTGALQTSNLLELGFFEFLFSSSVVEVLSEEINSYVKIHLRDRQR